LKIWRPRNNSWRMNSKMTSSRRGRMRPNPRLQLKPLWREQIPISQLLHRHRRNKPIIRRRRQVATSQRTLALKWLKWKASRRRNQRERRRSTLNIIKSIISRTMATAATRITKVNKTLQLLTRMIRTTRVLLLLL